MSTTPTPLDHENAAAFSRNVAPLAPWQRERLAELLAAARAEALEGDLRDRTRETDTSGRTPRDRELGQIIVGMHSPRWPGQTAARIAQTRADVRREAREAARLVGRREVLDRLADLDPVEVALSGPDYVRAYAAGAWL